ncbi:ABC transporter permease [Clostridia bacterium]|nr:ABC transporter permease [Clostridia bacterium]
MNNLLLHTAFSLWRLAAGVAVSLIAGTVIGIALGYCEKPRKVFSPVIYVLAPIPKIALLPLVMLLFGIGELSKIFIIFLVMVFQVVLTVTGATLRVPAEYYIPSRVANMGHWFVLRQIVFPAVLPELFTAVRIGLATGISVLFFAETFGTRHGLGFYIMDMWMRLEYPKMALGIGVLGLIGLVFTLITDFVERKVCKWKTTKNTSVWR